jgi:hypothetical protein
MISVTKNGVSVLNIFKTNFDSILGLNLLECPRFEMKILEKVIEDKKALKI